MRAWSSVDKCVRVGEGGDEGVGTGVGKGVAVGMDEGIGVVQVVVEGTGEGACVRTLALVVVKGVVKGVVRAWLRARVRVLGACCVGGRGPVPASSVSWTGWAQVWRFWRLVQCWHGQDGIGAA